MQFDEMGLMTGKVLFLLHDARHHKRHAVELHGHALQIRAAEEQPRHLFADRAFKRLARAVRPLLK